MSLCFGGISAAGTIVPLRFTNEQGGTMEADLAEVYRSLAKRYRTVDQYDLDDAIAGSRVVVWEARERGVMVNNAEAFCMTVARRLLSKEALRQRRHYYPDQVGPEEWSSLDTVYHAITVIEQPEASVDAQEVLDQAPERYAEVLRLHYLEGLSLEEIAVLLDVTPECVRKRHERALKWARKQFT